MVHFHFKAEVVFIVSVQFHIGHSAEADALSGVVGGMISRGALGNPFVFSGKAPTRKELIDTALRHFHALINYKGEYVGIRESRKHLAWYVKGMRGAAKIKDIINTCEKADEIENILLQLKQEN